MKLNKSILAVAISCVVVSGNAQADITSIDAARVDVSNSATRLADAKTAYDYAFGATSMATSSEMLAAKKELREAQAAYDAAKMDYNVVGKALTIDNQQRTAAQHIDMNPRPMAGIAPTGKPVNQLTRLNSQQLTPLLKVSRLQQQHRLKMLLSRSICHLVVQQVSPRLANLFLICRWLPLLLLLRTCKAQH
ncbi:hypothetical protein [Enterobacter hormaechei]|uniref:hypothetical protein n=1 Tax=Enterobacter hormaechei TaxID=158836 RepID=UPI0039E909BF